MDTGCTNILVRSIATKNSSLQIVQDHIPLYTIADSNRPGATIIGRAVADVCVDSVVGAEHDVLVVSDHTIPVDVHVGRSWLQLLHVSYL